MLSILDIDNLLYEVCYLGDYKQKYDGKIKEMKIVKEQLAECRAELATMMDRIHIKLVDAQMMINQSELLSSKTIEDFKKSVAFKGIIQDHIQEACDHIYVIECIEEGFIHGNLKGVCLVQRKTGVEVDGLTPSHASNDPPSNSSEDDSESELKKVFTSEDEDVEIL
ncbi:hypothetical protein IEQ34_022437 [Dendrobium chrysotoxum]|uniref:Uncharacterized protein n=1 Tax=Dendrobium chrysotoxum TaxID=161865 RepID=A0AAV7FYZ1_DENCH|nr:hypothetical protein IEQ34_022437 [Dendrobium chrysotoxum]